MRIPTATYRLQFNTQFTFTDAVQVIPYLSMLGISDIYASPVFKARQGSSHGYDVVDANEINPELGGKEELVTLSAALSSRQMGWLQDIVPNHMAFDSQNRMLIDLLENGSDSQYLPYFDIDWNHPYEGIHGRVLAPFLGGFYGDCLERGELQLQYDRDGFSINYYNLHLPLKIESYSNILSYNLNELREELGRQDPDFVKFLGVLYSLKYIPSGEQGNERYDQITFIKSMLWELWSNNTTIQQSIQRNLTTFNGEPNRPESFALLDSLLTEQFFRLSFWKVGNEELNYRRFFTVNDLISVRVEDEGVFLQSHELIVEFVRKGIFTGLRIDHIDGLYDPKQYLERLRLQIDDTYIVVEKILESKEELPVNWPTQGTTGYDFLYRLNSVFCQQTHRDAFSVLYDRFVGRTMDYEALVDEKKRLIVSKHLAGDIDNLAHLLKTISTQYRYASDFTSYGLKASLIEIMVLLPVYRTYINDEGLSLHDRFYVEEAIRKAKESMPVFTNELNFISRFLFLDFDHDLAEQERQQWLYFTRRLQQYTGPLMAKGLEDTTMYIYNRLVSLNEVGSELASFGCTIDDFHEFNLRQLSKLPHALLATATHDTKRGEDTRARINVLSEIPDEWEQYIHHWRQLNQPFKQQVGNRLAPDPNDEYLLYQTLIGSMPFAETEFDRFVDRVREYTVKAIREAKVHTGWLQPDSSYEQACVDFVTAILGQKSESPFLTSFSGFQKKIAHYGMFNSLSQVLLKIGSVGVPDFYQGTELWDFSLVDPDNRRPVNFSARYQLLEGIQKDIDRDIDEAMTAYLANPADGKMKLFTIFRALKARNHYLDLFQKGEYIPLHPIGSLQQHLISFARRWENQMAIVVVPRLLTTIVKEGELPLGEKVWHENRISLPLDSPAEWIDALSGKRIFSQEALWIREIFQVFPVALLIAHSNISQKTGEA